MKEIPLFKIFSDQNDIDAVVKILKSRKNWAVGDEVVDFENEIRKFIGTDYALTFNSGTSAIYASLIAADIGKGDEIIVPAFTYIATVEPVSLVGAKPVFADIETKNLGLDPNDVKKKITSRTKAIIAVHYAGMPCQIVQLRKIAEENHLLLIEDAAEAFGSEVAGKKVGTFGHIGIFSFSQGKIITTGEGGAVVTDSKTVLDKLKLVRSLGKKDETDTTHHNLPNDHIIAGHNLRLSNILSALGRSQLAKIDEVISRRIALAKYYYHQLNKIDEIEVFFNEDQKIKSGYQLFSIFAIDRDKLQKHLTASGITSRVYFAPVYHHFLYRNYSSGEPIAEEISKKILSIPFYVSMSKKQVDYIVAEIKRFYSK